MESYNESYEYKDEVLERFKNYNPIVHTQSEKDYEWLDGDNCYSIEIKNNSGDSLFIDLEGEITISYGDWHCHYYYEDRSDYEAAMEKVDSILNNADCHLIIYSNGKWFGSGSSTNKEKYTNDEAVEFIKTFFVEKTYNEFCQTFKKYGVNIKFEFWNKEKDYELTIEKERFE